MHFSFSSLHQIRLRTESVESHVLSVQHELRLRRVVVLVVLLLVNLPREVFLL